MMQSALVTAQARPSFSEFTATEYMQIDVAGTYGLDKESWTTRINWTQSHEAQFTDVEEQAGDHTLVQQADEPAQFYAAVCAYNKVLKGEPTGHMISLDATASGLQILAALVGCEESAELCNLINTGERVDAYTSLYEVMKDVNEGDLEIEEEGALALPSIAGVINLPTNKKVIQRTDFKQAIMTLTT
jgi:DNA-directed RNA polymerase